MVANVYMEVFEEQALSSSTLIPKLWLRYRYVDDTFVVWQHGPSSLDKFHQHKFHQHLNAQHPSIQFTEEEESGGKIPFLDVMVERIGAAATSYHSLLQAHPHG